MHPYQFHYYFVDRELIDAVKAVTLQPVKTQSGHSGTGYDQGWICGLSNTRLTGWQTMPPIRDAIHSLMRVVPMWEPVQVMVNRLDGHSKLDVHRDSKMPLPKGVAAIYRFHLPIVTGNGVFWWDEIRQQQRHLGMHYWHGPMPFMGVLHEMTNGGTEPRIHMVVDLAAPE